MVDYQKVDVIESSNKDVKYNSWVPLLRQVAISSAVCSSFFQMGLCFGSPPVVIAQLRRQNITVTGEQASWLSSTAMYSAFPWNFLLPWMSTHIGMRLSFAIVAVTTLLGFICFYLSTTITHLFISFSIQGILVAAEITISINSISDYTSPGYRGIVLTAKTASIHWGIWVGNALGTFCHWKTIGIFGILCSVYNFVLVFIWPESPCWLAGKGRYEQCRKAHRWLKGTSPKAEEELESLINSYRTIAHSHEESPLSKIGCVIKDMRAKEFYKPVLLSCTLVFLLQTTGKYVIAMYALKILHTITGKESAAYSGMLILDGVSVLGMYIGSILTKFINRRTMFFGIESLTMTFLCIISLYLYLIKLEIIVENAYVSISLLSIYILSMSCGPTSMSTALYGELMPLRGRTIAAVIVAVLLNSLMATIVKLSPLMFKTFGIHGGFFFLFTLTIIPYIVLYKYLPETRNKTLTEIESCFKSDQRLNSEKNQVTESPLVSAKLTSVE